MLDYRIQTFLKLCETKNYTKTAEQLHITQPAVTQHIHHLEQNYNTKLFQYQGRELKLTDAGKRLHDFALSVRADEDRLRKQIIASTNEPAPLCFGATLTIGEYTMPPILRRALDEMPDLKLTMRMKNTKELLAELEKGEVDFALVEGNFDRSLYDTLLFSREKFIAVCAPNHPLANCPNISLNDLLKERLFVREIGSGTRSILEQALYEKNLTLSSFAHIVQLGNMTAIKELVSQRYGIAFLYQEAVTQELISKRLTKLLVKDFDLTLEFDFVSLKNSIHIEEYHQWLRRFQQWRSQN